MQQNDQPLVGEVVSRNSPPAAYAGSRPTRPRYHGFALLLVGINVAVYLMMVLRGVSPFSPTVQDLQHWGAMYGPLFAMGQRWRLLTSGFVHIGLIHIAFNMWCLWYLAELSETIFGGWTTVAIYLLTAMTSSLLSVMWHPMVTSAGASGAIFGLAGAIIISLRIGNHHVPEVVRRNISNSAFRFALYNLIFGLLPGIDNAGHFGGIIGGLLLGAAYAGTDSMVTQSNDPLRRSLVSLAFLVLLSAVLFWYFPLGHLRAINPHPA